MSDYIASVDKHTYRMKTILVREKAILIMVDTILIRVKTILGKLKTLLVRMETIFRKTVVVSMSSEPDQISVYVHSNEHPVLYMQRNNSAELFCALLFYDAVQCCTLQERGRLSSFQCSAV